MPSTLALLQRLVIETDDFLRGAIGSADPIYIVIIAAVVVAVISAVLIKLFNRKRGIDLAPADTDQSIHRAEGELAALRDAKTDAEKRLAVEEQKAALIPVLEKALGEKTDAVDALRDAKVAAERDLAVATEASSQTKETLSRTLAKVDELERQLRDDATRADAAQIEKAKLDDELATKREAVRHNADALADLKSRLDGIEGARAELQKRFDALKDDKAHLEKTSGEIVARLDEKTSAAEAQRRYLEEAQAELKASKADLATLRTAYAKLQETLDQEKKQADDKLTLLMDAKEQMRQQFRVLAEEVMKNHGDTFSKQNKEQIDGLLTPLKDKLVEFQQGLQNAQTDSAKERATLGEQIRQLTDSSAKMNRETQNLTRALKGKAQTQGAWGEMILATILERCGLRKGEEYVTQESHPAEDGSRLRPDVIVNLPNSERIIIDSKVSLTAFESYVNAEDDTERATNLAKHILSLRTHIKTLSAKEYQHATGTGIDFVIMFVPIEGALAAALQEEPALTAQAADAHVAIATPTTLMMALKTVASLWQVERRNQNAELIADRAGKLYDKFVGFVGDMQSLDKRLVQAREAYDDAMAKLSIGRGNLIGQVEMLKGMGAKTAKALPAGLIAEDELVTLPEPETANT
jgi:DNA recombination protein RmuC